MKTILNQLVNNSRIETITQNNVLQWEHIGLQWEILHICGCIVHDHSPWPGSGPSMALPLCPYTLLPSPGVGGLSNQDQMMMRGLRIHIHYYHMPQSTPEVLVLHFETILYPLFLFQWTLHDHHLDFSWICDLVQYVWMMQSTGTGQLLTVPCWHVLTNWIMWRYPDNAARDPHQHYISSSYINSNAKHRLVDSHWMFGLGQQLQLPAIAP